jgi:hypothetical protein
MDTKLLPTQRETLIKIQLIGKHTHLTFLNKQSNSSTLFLLSRTDRHEHKTNKNAMIAPFIE